MSGSYERLYLAFKKRYNGVISKKQIQVKCNKTWNELKDTHRIAAELTRAAEIKIKELNEEGTRRSASLLNYFAKVNVNKNCKDTENATEAEYVGKVSEVTLSTVESVSADDSKDDKSLEKGSQEISPVCNDGESKKDSEPSTESVSSPSYPKPRQEVLEKEIQIMESELNCLIMKRDAGLTDLNIEQQVKKMRRDLNNAKKKLNDKKVRANWQKEYRRKQREEIHSLKRLNPENTSLKDREEVGRPRVEDDQAGLLQAICDMALHSGSADDRRRSEAIRACTTLDKLHDELKLIAFNLSRSATYLRLIPRSSVTTEGKRHVITVPVKLCTAQADHHRDHEDQYFCRTTISGLEEVASILGPKQVCIISQDDKAKVPLGMTAAKAQAPILMHVEYKVRLPDHDWMVGSRHKLTPSVYAGITVKNNLMGRKEAVTHSGPTYIAIRSGKHSSSTASTHEKDLERLLELDDFQPIMKGADGKIKPVLMMSVDGGPDENPRYKKVISHAISNFKNYGLNAIFIFTNAPGRSAFNRVERRMAPLSRVLSGVILPHDKYGTHLDCSGKTIDADLELENFQYAGEILAQIWSEIKIDGYNVIAEFIPSGETVPDPIVYTDSLWYANHVRESQYLLQIVKCDDKDCCSPYRSNLRQTLYQRFLPAPYPLSQDPFCIPPPSDHKSEFPSLQLRQTITLRPEYLRTKEIPYDFYCPSLQSEISNRTCPSCGLYFASKVSLACHKKTVHRTEFSVSRVTPLQVLSQRPGELLVVLNSVDTLEWIDVEYVEDADSLQFPEQTLENSISVINNVNTWISDGIPFVED